MTNIFVSRPMEYFGISQDGRRIYSFPVPHKSTLMSSTEDEDIDWLRHCSTFLSRYYYHNAINFLRITIILAKYYYVYLFFFAFTMAKRYSTKEACEILMNDEFSESDSEDSLDYETGSDSSSTVSYSEVNPDPENDFSG